MVERKLSELVHGDTRKAKALVTYFRALEKGYREIQIIDAETGEVRKMMIYGKNEREFFEESKRRYIKNFYGANVGGVAAAAEERWKNG